MNSVAFAPTIHVLFALRSQFFIYCVGFFSIECWEAMTCL
jgi:hypothetical protein